MIINADILHIYFVCICTYSELQATAIFVSPSQFWVDAPFEEDGRGLLRLFHNFVSTSLCGGGGGAGSGETRYFNKLTNKPNTLSFVRFYFLIDYYENNKLSI